jgi:prepilin-type N-terminal cleavage/methylation domain-containing protein
MRYRITEGCTQRRSAQRHFSAVQKSGAGFTLIEIILVIALIGLLASVVFASLSGAIEKGRVSRAQADLSEFRQAIILLEHDTGLSPGGFDNMGSCLPTSGPIDNDFPLNDSVVIAGLVNDNGKSGWNGPYIPTIADDPWGNLYYFDDDYTCVPGATGCEGFPTTGNVLRVIHSGGPNGSIENTYDADNIVLVLCVH